jgi:hypothetical protein
MQSLSYRHSSNKNFFFFQIVKKKPASCIYLAKSQCLSWFRSYIIYLHVEYKYMFIKYKYG